MTRIFPWAVMTVAITLLAGCYESNALLLDAAAARQPVSSYDDWKYTRGDATYHARLNPRADGWYDYEEAMIDDNGSDGDWTHYTLLLNYLENAAGMDVYIYAYWDDDEKAYMYGLVAFLPDGRWQSLQPSCDYLSADDDDQLDRDIAAAQAAGAELRSSDMADICYFSTAGSLFDAMRTLVRDNGFRQRVEGAAN